MLDLNQLEISDLAVPGIEPGSERVCCAKSRPQRYVLPLHHTTHDECEKFTKAINVILNNKFARFFASLRKDINPKTQSPRSRALALPSQ